jgi:hypothetical protein
VNKRMMQVSPINRDLRFAPTGKGQGSGTETEEKRKEQRVKSKGQGSRTRNRRKEERAKSKGHGSGGKQHLLGPKLSVSNSDRVIKKVIIINEYTLLKSLIGLI